jgi:primosomal protein N'
VRVAVERGIDRLPTSGDGSLTYRVMPPEVRPVAGQRVEVPLGKAGTATQGIIVEVGDASLADEMDASRVRSITRLRDEVIPADILALARWMAGYYVCPLGMVLAGMLPAAVKRGTGRKRVEMATLVSTTLAEDTKLRPAARRAHDALCKRVATEIRGHGHCAHSRSCSIWQASRRFASWLRSA